MSLVPLAERDIVNASGIGAECWYWEVKGNRAEVTHYDPRGWLLTARYWVAIITDLKVRCGWKRSGRISPQGPYWDIYAYLRHGDAEVRITGFAWDEDRPEGCSTNSAVPFWAPDPPPIEHHRRKGWKGQYEDWDRKCLDDEW